MLKLSEINETYLREEPIRERDPKSERVQQIEEFAHNKSKKEEIAVKNNGDALYCVPEEKRTEEMCLEAVKNNGDALKYVPEEKLTEEICCFSENAKEIKIIKQMNMKPASFAMK